MNIANCMGRDIALLGHPFDEYQRYQDIRVVVDIIQSQVKENGLKVLDVGGTATASKFLSGYRVMTTNMEVETRVEIQSDGTKLPLMDKSFDAVITVDTLEHIAPDQRRIFVEELLRVTKSYTIITGPFANGFNEASEATLNDFLTKIIGLEHRFLLEHLDNGLPDLEICLEWVKQISNDYVVIPSGYVNHWLPLMIIRHYLARLPNGGALREDIDRVYNYKCYWHDHKLPSYRQVIVVAKKGDPQILDHIKDAFTPPDETPPPDLNGVIGMVQALRWLQLLEEQNTEITRLRELVTGYESGRLMRLLSAIHQLKSIFKRKG